MKHSNLILILALAVQLFNFPTFQLSNLYAQNVAINTSGATGAASAMLDVSSTTAGFAMPRMTSAQRKTIAGPIEGLLVYDTDLKGYYFYNGTKWDCVTTPAGTVDYFASATPPNGYLECNGQAVNRTTYAELFAAIGTFYGVGDNSTTFNLPDLRGEFIRGYDDGRGVDASRAMGSLQPGTIEAHTHNAGTLGGTTSTDGDHSHTYRSLLEGGDVDRGAGSSNWSIDNTVVPSTSTAGAHSHTLNITGATASAGSTETRPRNVALLPCIKY